MALRKIKLGNYISLCDEKNTDEKYSLEYVKGISTQKYFIETKANMDGVPLKGYKIVRPGCFAYVPDTSRRGDKISLAYNDTDKPILVSSISIVFKVANKELSSMYLFMYFNRPEFDRYSRYNSFGSAREPFNWEDMCDIEIELPDLPTQEKFVKVYLSMLENQKAYERGLEDLKLVMNSYFDKIKTSDQDLISNYIEFSSDKNYDLSVSFAQLRGINELGEFTSTRDSIGSDDIDKYLIIKDKTFAVNFMCLGNFGKFYLAYNDFGEDYLVSPACNCFKIKNVKLNPYYLLFVLKRSEFQRRCVVLGDGNTRGGINITDFSSISIPIASVEQQIIISDLYNSYENRRKINEKLKEQIKDICPILIKGSIEEAKEA